MLKSVYLLPEVQHRLANRATYPRQGRMIFPEIGPLKAIMSDDDAYIAFMRLIRDDLMELCPPSEAKDGLFDHRAVATSWSNASFVAGYAMSPATVPPVSNDALVQDLGLATTWVSPMHEIIYERLFSFMFDPSGWEPAGAHFNKLSSTGAPFAMSNDPKAKFKILADALRDWHKIGELALLGKFEEMARLYHAAPLHILGFRAQSSDSVTFEDGKFTPKERLVNDLEYALSGGARGRRFAADRSVVINGKLLPDMFGQRLRTVWGAPGWLTYPFTCLLAQARKGYFHRGEFTWEHRGSEDIRRKLEDAEALISLDVSQYDQSFSRFMVDKFLECWDRILPPTSAALMRLNFHMPFLLPSPDVDGMGYRAIGDPGRRHDFAYGLPSGIAVNPDCGKMHVPFAIMCVVDDLYHDCHTSEQIAAFLAGQHPIVALLNCGDDSFIKIRKKSEARAVHDALASCKSGWYFSMEPEKAGSFLGHVVYRDREGQVAVCPKISSYFENWYMPERGVDHRSRRDFWAIGAREREALYLQCPEADVVFRVINDRFKQCFYARPSDYVIGAPQMTTLSDISKMVLVKPDLLNYQHLQLELLDESVKKQVISSLDEQQSQWAAEVLMKG